eukprot:NODE_20165_length_810_cov_1.734993.p4 GENE.NODE_20165_length_810_cov_1.734993~~NODE_20165_length_810_cov_1.734993.p4  ORF type:complete len:86 (-),score=31.70 NODE_20165_length_810_cov_1.734993:102-359(-)
MPGIHRPNRASGSGLRDGLGQSVPNRGLLLDLLGWDRPGGGCPGGGVYGRAVRWGDCKQKKKKKKKKKNAPIKKTKTKKLKKKKK